MEKRTELVKGLRQLATFLETHTHVPVPYNAEVNIWPEDKDALAAIARGTGAWEKEHNNSYFILRKSFGDHVRMDVNLSREQICRRVVVGMKTIAATPEREVDIVEWVCDEPLLDGMT